MQEQDDNGKLQDARADEAFPLSEEVIKLLAEINAEVARLNAQAQGALLLFLRQHKLEGPWNVAPNGRELVKRPAAQMSMPQQ